MKKLAKNVRFAALPLLCAVMMLAMNTNASAQEKSDTVPPAPKNKTLTVTYGFENLNHQYESQSGSRLSWHDVFMHDIAVKLEKLGKDASHTYTLSLGKSWNAIHTDEDIQPTQEDKIISFSYDVSAFKVAAAAEKHMKFMGNPTVDFNRKIMYTFVHFRDRYDQSFIQHAGYVDDFSPGELSSTYSYNALALRYGLTKKSDNKHSFYTISANLGPQIDIGFANWVHRDVFCHPISFMNLSADAGFDVNATYGIKVAQNTSIVISIGVDMSKQLLGGQTFFYSKDGGEKHRMSVGLLKDEITSAWVLTLGVRFK